jgi:cation transporter-like permease
MKKAKRQTNTKAKRILKFAAVLLMIFAPIWGYIAMLICKLTNGGQVFDTVSFYLMVIGWMLTPIGILLFLYGVITSSILEQRKHAARR